MSNYTNDNVLSDDYHQYTELEQSLSTILLLIVFFLIIYVKLLL